MAMHPNQNESASADNTIGAGHEQSSMSAFKS